jgi:hypothetical protein
MMMMMTTTTIKTISFFLLQSLAQPLTKEYTSFLSEEAKSDPKTRQEELKERARMLLEQVQCTGF